MADAGAIYPNAVGRGETGAAAMTFDLILIGLAIALDPIGKSLYLIAS
jgi:hypothetical protein